MTQIIGIFLVFEVLVRQKDRLLLNFSYFLSNEIYFGCIFTVGNRNRSLKILFLGNVDILECENNIPLKTVQISSKRRKTNQTWLQNRKGRQLKQFKVSWMSLFALKFLDAC